jgi:MFS family permease
MYAKRDGRVESQIGFLTAAASVTALIIRPFSGVIADLFDRKKY